MTWFAEHCLQEHRPLVRLWGHDGAALIIRWPSGLWYSNQTDGHSCRQPVAQGILVPCERVRSKDGKRGPLSWALSNCDWPGAWLSCGIQDAVVDQVEAVFAEFNMTASLHVDRDRKQDSGEAWVFVRVLQDLDSAMEFRGLVTYPIEAVLTWPNSD